MTNSLDEIVVVTESGHVLAKYIPASVAWRPGLSFFSDDLDFIQVGTWGYDSGKKLASHMHNEVTRESHRTQEVVFVRRGKIRAVVLGSTGCQLAAFDLSPGDLLLLLGGGHGYEILHNGTEVLEIKNGPYLGPDVDRRRI